MGSGRKGNIPQRVPLPPPMYGSSSFSSSKTSRATSFNSPSFTKPSHTSYEPSVPPYYGDSNFVGTVPPTPSSTYDNQVCPIYLTNPKDMAFGCGHQTCCECGQDLQSCPICRSAIQTRIKMRLLGSVNGWSNPAYGDDDPDVSEYSGDFFGCVKKKMKKK